MRCCNVYHVIAPVVGVLQRAADPTAAAVPEQNKRGKKSSPAKAASDAEQGAAAQQPAAAAAAAGSSGAQQRQFFLMKSEPDVFSIDDLGNKPNQTEAWDGETGRNGTC